MMDNLWYGYSDAHFARLYGEGPIHLIAQAASGPRPRHDRTQQSLCGARLSYGAQGPYTPGFTDKNPQARMCKRCLASRAKLAPADA